MKQLFTLTFAVFAVLSASAQAPRSSLINRLKDPKNFKQHVANMLRIQDDNQDMAKTTVAKQRVTGESTYDVSGFAPALLDSTNFKYTGYNGSKFNFNDMYYNHTYPSNFNPGSDYPYGLSTVDVMSDTMNYLFMNATLELTESSRGAYNANKNVTQYKDYVYSNGSVAYSDYYYGQYNAQGRLVRLYDNYGNGSAPDSDTRFDIYYDAQNRPVKDSIFNFNLGNWDPAGELSFTYDASGNLTVLSVIADYGPPIGWVNVAKYTHTFYASNKLKTVVLDYFDQNTMSLQSAERDTFAYDAANKFTVLTRDFVYNGTTWDPNYAIEKHVNAQGLPDTVYNESWTGSSWDVADRLVYTYNSYSNPVQGRDYANNGSSYDLAYIYNFYYEDYNDLSVGDYGMATDFKLYPNPAKDQLNLSSKAIIGKEVVIDLINASGQLTYSEHTAWNSETKTVSLSALTPGIYWVRVSDNKGNAMFHQSVIKQ